ncbi:hypothetical protein Tco_0591550 [Tanacetum coccineum]
MKNTNPPSTFKSFSQQPLATDAEQVLESMEHQIDPLMKEAVLLVGSSRNLWQLFPEPPRQNDSLDDSTKRNLQGVLTLRVEDDWKGYWPSIGDGKFVVRATIAKKIRDPIIRLARYLKRARDISVLCGRMFMTKIAQSFVLLSKEMVDTLSMDPRAQTFTKKSLIAIDVVMELDEGNYCWQAVQGVGEDDEMEEEAEEPVGAYIVRVHRDNLDPHLQIDPFPGREDDYPPPGYTGHMPTSYDYRFHTAPDGPR